MMKYCILRKRGIALLMRGLGSLECRELEILSEGTDHSVVDVNLTTEILQESAVEAVKLFKAANGMLEEEANIRVGLLGQAATTFYIWHDARKGLYQMEYGKPDLFDISFKGFKIDIKTFEWYRSSEPDTWMLVKYAQFNNPERHYPYYIACQRISEGAVRILGFISRNKLESVCEEVGPDKPPFYKEHGIGVKSLNAFTPINKLSETLEKEKSRRAQTTLKFNS